MSKYSNQKLTELVDKVLRLQIQEKQPNAKSSVSSDLENAKNDLSEINKFHNEYKLESEKLFGILEQKIKYMSSWLYGNHSYFYGTTPKLVQDSFKSLQQGLEKSIKEIKGKNISNLIPDDSKNDSKVIWQYRYALLISFLDHWSNSEQTKKMKFIKEYLDKFHQIVNSTNIEREDQLISSTTDQITYQALYEKALQQNILTKDSITENLLIIEAEYNKSEDERLKKINDEEIKNKKAKASAEDSLKLCKKELDDLRINYLVGRSEDGLIKVLIDSVDHFIGKDLNIYSTLTEEMAAEVLGDASLMLKHFNLCLNPSLSEERKENEKIVYEHAKKLSKKVEMNKNDKNEKLLGTILLVIGLIILALALAAAIAASHGVFLGLIPFATTKAIIATKGIAIGTTVMVHSDAWIGCFITAFFGFPTGTALTFWGASSFFNMKNNAVKEKGQAFAEAAKSAAEGSESISKPPVQFQDFSKSENEADKKSMAKGRNSNK